MSDNHDTDDYDHDLDNHSATSDHNDGATPVGHYHKLSPTRHEHNDGTSHYHVCTGPHNHDKPHPTDDYDGRSEVRRRLAARERGPIESTR